MIRTYSILLLLVFSICPAGAVETDLFEYRRSLEANISKEGLGTIELDRDVFSHTGDHFPDLRLFQKAEGNEVEVPFVIERVPDVRAGSSAMRIPSSVLSFSPMPDGDIEIRVQLREGDDDAALLELKTPLQNFQKSVSVSGVGENGELEELVSDKLIFDYEVFLDFRRTTLKLPSNHYREFLVRISNATDKQRSTVKQLTRTISPDAGTTIQQSETVETRRFRIDEFAFYTAETPREEKLSIRSESFEIVSVEEDPEEKVTQILFQGDRVPVDSLIFQSSDRNFKRRVEVQVPVNPDEDLWRTIHTGAIHRFDLGEIQDENLTLSFSEQRSELFRLLIHNRDNPPIAITEIVGVGEIYEMRFLVAPGAGYTLLYGGSDLVERPDYDVAAIEAGVTGGIERVSLELGEMEKNPTFKPQVVKGPGLNQPWILWISIAVAVSGLVLVLLKTAKQIEENTG